VRYRLLAIALAAALGACDDHDGSAAGPTTPTGTPHFDARALSGGCGDGSETELFDLNRDGTADFVATSESGGTCRAVDMNFDGSFDLYRHRDSAGGLLREEADLDYDGRLDAVATHAGGGFAREDFDTNWDGNVDFWVVLQQSCSCQSAPSQTCITQCGVPWCAPRRLPQAALVDEEEEAAAAAAGRVPRCDDHIRNGVETDNDCGGACGPCDDGKRCDRSSDCRNGSCVLGYCGATLPVAVLYRDGNGDALWDTAEVLLGEHPICVAFNTNLAGDTPDVIRPESVEVYKPASARSGRADIDYMRKTILDSNNNPVVTCEDTDGATIECPTACGP
jgi:hypothetical protein